MRNWTSTSAIAKVARVIGLAAAMLASSAPLRADRSDTAASPPLVLASSQTPTPVATASPAYSVLAWNDLGMHCMDGKDYSVYSILPPYNNLHAQVVDRSSGKLVTSGIKMTYKSYADANGSINSFSAGKVNFWDYSLPLFGASLAPDMGLTGNPTASLKPRPLAWNGSQRWFEATGIPITPYDDSGAQNFYPMVEVAARDPATNTILAKARTVLPVSDEISCVSCHASRASGNAAELAAKPKAGWAFDPNPEKDWKYNVLRLHDEKQLGKPLYTQALAARGYRADGLYATSRGGTPSLCATCHASNALPGSGYAGVPQLTTSLHSTHGLVNDPASGALLNSGASRNTCYLCHPGSTTQCLRGAMGAAKDAQGNMLMQCQSCHGNMAKVGDASRVGWLQEPTCQACHFSGKRTTSVFLADGSLNKPTDRRFATVANVPAAGYDLYRFSSGHGGLQCEACHGATHAEYPSTEPNDNVLSIKLQGHTGTIRECTACHATVPSTATGGPHGLHTIGQAWVGKHGDYTESHGSKDCAACHGANYRGAPQSQVKVAETLKIESGRSKTYPVGAAVGCYDCHNGPGGG